MISDLLDSHVIRDCSRPWGQIILDFGQAEHYGNKDKGGDNEESILLKLMANTDAATKHEIIKQKFPVSVKNSLFCSNFR